MPLIFLLGSAPICSDSLSVWRRSGGGPRAQQFGKFGEGRRFVYRGLAGTAFILELPPTFGTEAGAIGTTQRSQGQPGQYILTNHLGQVENVVRVDGKLG